MADNNNNSANIEDLLKLAECPICSELKTDHRILVNCGHSFCLDDLEALVKKGGPNSTCPLCRVPFVVPQQGVKSLIKDFHKIALVELALKWQNANFGSVGTKDICCECSKEASLWCQEEECGFCDEHAEQGHRIGKAKTHNLVLPSKKIVKVLCSSHKKELEKFCTACGTVICIDCFVFDHVGHKIGTLDSVAEERKKVLLQEWKEIADKLSQKLTNESKLIEETSASVEQNLKEVKEKTTDYFNEMIALLQKRKEELLSMVQDKEQQHKAIIARKNQLLKSLEEITMQTQALTSMSQRLSAVKWLEMEKSIRQDFSKWNHESEAFQVEKFEPVLPEIKSLILTSGLVSKLQPQAAPVTELSLELDRVQVLTYSDQWPRGYEVTPKMHVTVTYVLVRVNDPANECSVVIADNKGILQQSAVGPGVGEWKRAEFNQILIQGKSYFFLLLRPQGLHFHYQPGTNPPRPVGEAFTVKSIYSSQMNAPYQIANNTYQIQFRIGFIAH